MFINSVQKRRMIRDIESLKNALESLERKIDIIEKISRSSRLEAILTEKFEAHDKINNVQKTWYPYSSMIHEDTLLAIKLLADSLIDKVIEKKKK